MTDIKLQITNSTNNADKLDRQQLHRRVGKKAARYDSTGAEGVSPALSYTYSHRSCAGSDLIWCRLVDLFNFIP